MTKGKSTKTEAKKKAETKEKLKPKEPAVPSKDKPAWLKFTDKDVEAIVVKLAKKGLTSEKIGLALRDTYGVPKTKLLGKKISKILKENELYHDANLINLEKKKGQMKRHLEKNKQDKKTRRALMILMARIAKLKKYKKRKNAGKN